MLPGCQATLVSIQVACHPWGMATMDPGALLATTHDGGDGLRVRLTLARPSHGALVRDFLEALSPESRRLRFLAPMPIVGEAAVRHFTFYDLRRRLVVAALTPLDGHEA